MSNIRVLCYGDSIDNLKDTFEYHIIGVPKRTNFSQEDVIYIALKIQSYWYICGKTTIIAETDLNPFIGRGNYYTYSTSECIACYPIKINDKSREILGQYWGLIFQNPRVIKDEEYKDFVESSFMPCTEEILFSEISCLLK